MGKSTGRINLELTLARLLDPRTEEEGHRILLEAALRLTSARAAALWRRGARDWSALLAVGEAELLPEERRVRTLLDSSDSGPCLRSGECLLAPPGCELALALAGTEGEEGLDELEALLLVQASTLDPRRIESPPLPRRNEPRPRTG